MAAPDDPVLGLPPHSLKTYPMLIITYLFLAMMALSVLGRWFKKARFLSRVLTCYFLMMACTSYGILASVVLRLIGKVGLAQWTTGRAFLAVTGPAMGVDFRVSGEDKLQTRPAVFISNHQSWVILPTPYRNLGNQDADSHFERTGSLTLLSLER